MKSTKKHLAASFVSLLLCVSMLLGTTYAWFTDSVTSGKNHIIAGNLDVEMYWSDDLQNWHNVEDPKYSVIFDYDLWEPGYTELRYIKVVNAGNLAMKYDINMLPNGTLGKLADVIDVYYIDEPLEPIVSRTAIKDMSPSGVLSDVIVNVPVVTGTLGKEETNTFGVVLKMQESAGNEYQNESVGEDGFSVILRATQLDAELDSFGDDYDAGVVLPAIIARDTKTVSVTDDQTVAEELLLGGRSDDNASAVVQAGVALAEGVTQLTFTVDPVEKSKANVRSSDELTRISLDVHVEGIAEGNTVPVIVTLDKYLPKNLNSTSVKLYHVENGETNEMTHVATAAELTAHNTFTYDSATGDVKMALCSFSEILITADESDTWKGTVGVMPVEVGGVYTINTAEELAAFAAAVNGGNDFYGMTVKLGKTIVLNDWKVDDSHDYTAEQLGDYNDPAFEHNGELFHKFTPIGKGSNLSNETAANDLTPFRGTFDGCGYAVSGLFNLWYDDPAHWSEQIGLFGCVENATIRNLTIRDSFIYTYGGMVGLVASFAGGNSTFENITIQDNFCTAYNNYLGGVVGCVFDYDDTNANVTFNNCYVDNSNLFKALWETYDAPIGGICGGAYANSDVTFKDCTVFPEMSLYNDCCANYQWFAYRYSGMLIGYVRSGDRANYLANKVHCERVTVKYGEWTDQYYCELVSAGKGSYNEPDEYKYRRIDKDQLKYDEDGKISGCDEAKTGHNHTAHPEEDHIAENIQFHQLFGGGQGVYGEETHDGVEIVENCGSIVKAFPNTDKYLYRVGNMNTVALGSLFKAESGTVIKSSAVKLTAEKIAGVSSVDYSVNTSDWTKSTLQFSGTGVVKLTLEYLTQEPIELNLEVVEAMNATTATSATANNVVLLNDCTTSGSIEISNGYYLYGNGFAINFTANGSYLGTGGMGDGFIKVSNGGVLDNTQVLAKVFPNAFLYASEAGTESNLDRTDGTKKYYKYQFNAVSVSGNSTISNSFIYGGRNNIQIGSGNVTIDNTTCECGALSNIHILSSSENTVTLNDVATIQHIVDDGFNAGKKVMGGGILLGSGDRDLLESETYPHLNITGNFNQYNWVCSSDKNAVTSSSYAKNLLAAALGDSNFVHSVNGTDYANMGIVYLNNITNTSDLISNSSNTKNDYIFKNISINLGINITGTVYSIKNGSGSVALNSDKYNPTTQSGSTPSVMYYDVSAEKVWNKLSNTAYQFTYSPSEVGTNYSFDLSKLEALIGGKTATIQINDSNGQAINGNIPLDKTGTSQYIISFSGKCNYNPDGTICNKETLFNIALKITVVLPDIVYTTPEKTSDPNQPAIFVGTGTGSFNIAMSALDGLKIKYWSTDANKETEIDFSQFTVTGSGAITDTNTWEYSGSDYYLKIYTDTKAFHSSGNDSGMAYSIDGKLYFGPSTGASKWLSTSTTGKYVNLHYVFKDGLASADENDGHTLKFNHSFTSDKTNGIPASNSDVYKFDSFKKGKLEANSGSGSGSGNCVTPETLITMADGTEKPICEVKSGDMLLAWDFFNGKYVTAPVVFNDGESEAMCEVIRCIFSDGTEVDVIGEHGFFDMTNGEFVYLDSNASKYIGHSFMKQDGTTVELADVIIEERMTTAFDTNTYQHLCFYNNGMLSISGGISGMFNIFDVDTDTMRYDEAKMRADIETYGLLDIDAFGGMITEDMFNAFNGKYLGVAVGKGNLTWEYIAYLAERYAPLCK